MHSETTFQSERTYCLMLKAKIVSCMSPEVKSQIENEGFTPAEIATEYIFRTYDSLNCADDIVDVHDLILNRGDAVVHYKDLQFDETGSLIIGITF